MNKQQIKLEVEKQLGEAVGQDAAPKKSTKGDKKKKEEGK